MKNGPAFDKAIERFSTDEQKRFMNYFIGSLSVQVDALKWQKAIKTATELMAASKAVRP